MLKYIAFYSVSLSFLNFKPTYNYRYKAHLSENLSYLVNAGDNGDVIFSPFGRNVKNLNSQSNYSLFELSSDTMVYPYWPILNNSSMNHLCFFQPSKGKRFATFALKVGLALALSRS